MAGTTNNGGEDSPGGVVSGEAGLAHAGAIVTDKSGNVLVTHLGCFEPGGKLFLKPAANEIDEQKVKGQRTRLAICMFLWLD